MIGPGFNMSDQNIKRKKFGTVPKQLGARWQKISPPVPQIYPPAQPVLGQTGFMWEQDRCKSSNSFWRNAIAWSLVINVLLNLREKLDIHVSSLIKETMVL